jgi:hypothetical protein
MSNAYRACLSIVFIHTQNRINPSYRSVIPSHSFPAHLLSASRPAFPALKPPLVASASVGIPPRINNPQPKLLAPTQSPTYCKNTSVYTVQRCNHRIAPDLLLPSSFSLFLTLFSLSLSSRLIAVCLSPRQCHPQTMPPTSSPSLLHEPVPTRRTSNKPPLVCRTCLRCRSKKVSRMDRIVYTT